MSIHFVFSQKGPIVNYQSIYIGEHIRVSSWMENPYGKSIWIFFSKIRGMFCSKNREYQYFGVCFPETSSCASKPLLLRCNLVIPQCMCQVSLRLKEVQMGAHDFKYNKVALFLLEKQGISILRCLLPRN